MESLDTTREQGVSPLDLVPLVFGYVQSRVVTTATRIGLPNALGDDARSATQLATTINADEDSVRRLLRALTVLGLTSQKEDYFTLTSLGSYLRSDVPDSIHPLAVMAGDDNIWRAWGDMERSVLYGTPAFDRLTGKGLFDYVAENPEVAAAFHDTMARTTRIIAPIIVDGYDFSAFRKVIDVGGGDGTLISTILQANPNTRGMVFDSVDGLEEAPEVIKRTGVEDRCELRRGNFFEEIPSGGDLYVLKNILNDWNDAQSSQIINNCAQAVGKHGKLIIIAPPMPTEINTEEATVPVIGDIEMMVTTGGRERTLAEYRDLLSQNGFVLGEVIPLEFHPYSIIEGLPA